MFLFGLLLGGMSLYTGYLTQKEKKLSIKKLKKDMDASVEDDHKPSED